MKHRLCQKCNGKIINPHSEYQKYCEKCWANNHNIEGGEKEVVKKTKEIKAAKVKVPKKVKQEVTKMIDGSSIMTQDLSMDSVKVSLSFMIRERLASGKSVDEIMADLKCPRKVILDCRWRMNNIKK